MARSRPRLLSLLLLLILLAGAALSPAPVEGSSGPTGGGAPAAGPDGDPASATEPDDDPASGGTSADRRDRKREREKRKPRRRSKPAPPVLSSFAVPAAPLFVGGRPGWVAFTLRSRTPAVRVALRLRRPGSRRVLRTLDLGERRPGVRQRVRLALAGLPTGRYEVVLAARDRSGRALARAAGAPGVRAVELRGHRLPVDGPLALGGEGARFGAARPGHAHEGQDITAPEGTPVRAPRGGRVSVVAFQAEGAGHYVVLDAAGEDRDYVFMHLQAGSIPVRVGQLVSTGARLGSVGSTGRSSGPHLHFEVWTGGPWRGGGRPVDPLPLLREWAAGR